jgi:hypothetical protein
MTGISISCFGEMVLSGATGHYRLDTRWSNLKKSYLKEPLWDSP